MNTTLQLFFVCLLIINIFSFLLVGFDKRKSISNKERYPEAFIFFISVFFASLGIFLGIFFFRHKVRKIYFPIGIGVLLLQQIALIALALGKLQ